MKTFVRIAAISGALMIGGLASGQDNATAKPVTPAPANATMRTAPASQARVADGWRGLPLGMLVKQVGLTTEQTQQGKELNAKYMKLYQGLDANMPLEERKVKVKELMDQREAEVKAMLTPVQQEKYANLRTPSGELRQEAPMPKDQQMKKAAPTEQKKSDM